MARIASHIALGFPRPSRQKGAVKLTRRLSIPILLLGAALGGGILYAQLDGAERGIPPIDSSSSLEVSGVEVDVAGPNAQAARVEGWRRAQLQGWKMLWARTNNRPISEAPTLSDSVLSGIVSGIVIEHEQIGPTRYIARLGVLFDRARTGQMLGVQNMVRRSQPMLVIPVMATGGTPYSMEFRNEWQHAWARFRTANSPIDYVRTSGSGADPLLLNAMQTGRRSRGWWRVLLDQYGASDVVVPRVQLSRLFPGGPAVATFTAHHGPNNELLARFQLRAPDAAGIPRMLDEGVRRIDAILVQALAEGRLTIDPSLNIPQPEEEPLPEEEETADAIEERSRPTEAREEEEDEAAPPPPAAARPLSISVSTPNVDAVQQAEVSVSRVSGVTSAITTSQQIGGTSLMRVTYGGDVDALAAALRSQGWNVSVSGNSLRMSR
jgi:hypothetical protein